MLNFAPHHKWLPVLFVVLISAFALRTNAEPPREKLPVPDKAAQEKALATIRDTYKEDYSNSDKAALAKKLIQKAKENQDSTERFVLLWEAENVALDSFLGELAFEAIDVIVVHYDVSAAQSKAKVIAQTAEKVRTAEQKRAIAEAALQVVDEAICEEKFDLAKEMITQANQLARLQEVASRSKEVGKLAKAYADAKEARDTLKTEPTDPDANLAVGKYLCFARGDWDKGLPMLAKGSNEKLKSLAERDMQGAKTPAEQVKVGNAWWDLARERAIYWYDKALPGLDGVEKDRVVKKTRSYRTYLADLTPTAFDTYQKNDPRKNLGPVCGKTPQHGLLAGPPKPLGAGLKPTSFSGEAMTPVMGICGRASA